MFLSGCPSVLALPAPLSWTYFKTNEPILVQNSESVLRGKEMQRSTLGSDLEAWQRPDSRPVRSSRFSSYILRSSAGAFPEISPDQTRNETCSNSNGEIGGTVAPPEPIELKLCTSDYVAHQRPHMHHGVTVGSWTSALDKGET